MFLVAAEACYAASVGISNRIMWHFWSCGLRSNPDDTQGGMGSRKDYAGIQTATDATDWGV